MSEKSAGIAAVLATTMLMTVFTTAMTLSMNYAEGQSIIQPHAGSNGTLCTMLSSNQQLKTKQILFVAVSHIHVDDTFAELTT